MRHWRNVQGEDSYRIDPEDIEGAIPSDLEGSFFRNGPGLTELGGHRLHPFDGHGMLFRASFQSGDVHVANRFVRTKAYVEETSANQILYRGFGTQKPGGILANLGELRDKNVANTSVWEWAGRLWALWEGDRSTIVDPVTLDTIVSASEPRTLPIGISTGTHHRSLPGPGLPRPLLLDRARRAWVGLSLRDGR